MASAWAAGDLVPWQSAS